MYLLQTKTPGSEEPGAVCFQDNAGLIGVFCRSTNQAALVGESFRSPLRVNPLRRSLLRMYPIAR